VSVEPLGDFAFSLLLPLSCYPRPIQTQLLTPPAGCLVSYTSARGSLTCWQTVADKSLPDKPCKATPQPVRTPSIQPT
jgi:hypothetical protein